jgi:hypothetical protein
MPWAATKAQATWFIRHNILTQRLLSLRPAGAPTLFSRLTFCTDLLDCSKEKARYAIMLLKAGGGQVVGAPQAEQQAAVRAGGSGTDEGSDLFSLFAAAEAGSAGKGAAAGGAGAGGTAGGSSDGAAGGGEGVRVLVDKKAVAAEQVAALRQVWPQCQVVDFEYVLDCIAAYSVLDDRGDKYAVA